MEESYTKIKKRTGSYKRKWNTESVNQYIKDNYQDVELLSEYVDMDTKMNFRCSCGNIFITSWHEFNSKKYPKRQCNTCGRKKPNSKNKITISFIKKYLSENNYTCELLSDKYIDCDSKLEFKCECENIFYASWSNIKRMSGFCKECVNKKRISSYEYIQNKINEIYKDNCYELIHIDDLYLKIKHNNCNNVFLVRKDHFFNGQGCKICNLKNRNFGQLSNDEFLNRLYKYLDEYDILTEYKNNHTFVEIKCKKCNNIFKKTPYHIYERGIYCPICNGSKGEQYIEKYLKLNDIYFIPQYRFNDCVDKKKLSFDFYLPNFNICIEYQGIQHYEPIEYFGGKKSFETQIYHDLIKRNYCKCNGIYLIEIPYYEINNIDSILNEEINKSTSLIKGGDLVG